MSPCASKAGLGLLTIQVGPLPVHVHQDRINGWTHLEAEKVLTGSLHGGPHSSRLNSTPRGVPRTLEGQGLEGLLRPQSCGKLVAEPELESRSPDPSLQISEDALPVTGNLGRVGKL